MLKKRLDFPNKEEIERMDRLAIVRGLKVVETMVRLSKWKKD